jgi:hypothetical protein
MDLWARVGIQFGAYWVETHTPYPSLLALEV